MNAHQFTCLSILKSKEKGTMHFRCVNLIAFIVFSIYIVNIFAIPRDSTAIIKIAESSIEKKLETSPKAQPTSEIKIPGRIWCQHEEATEDVVCQEHCLPKGYSYGICVSNTCSCI